MKEALRELLTEEEHVWISRTVGQHNLLKALSGRVQKAVGLVELQSALLDGHQIPTTVCGTHLTTLHLT